MAKKPTYQIPFNKEGVLQSYVSDYGDPEWLVWKDNYEFKACLRYDGYGRGRSSAVIMMLDSKTAIRYPMFLSSFDDLMRSKVHFQIQGDGMVSFCGKFTFCKKGTNYGLTIASRKEEEKHSIFLEECVELNNDPVLNSTTKGLLARLRSQIEERVKRGKVEIVIPACLSYITFSFWREFLGMPVLLLGSKKKFYDTVTFRSLGSLDPSKEVEEVVDEIVAHLK